jgi:hypothetical protein
MQDLQTKLAQLHGRLWELERRWPKHSVPTAMALEREDLEEEIQQLQKMISTNQTDEQISRNP